MIVHIPLMLVQVPLLLSVIFYFFASLCFDCIFANVHVCDSLLLDERLLWDFKFVNTD
jgi:hypothetical protein